MKKLTPNEQHVQFVTSAKYFKKIIESYSQIADEGVIKFKDELMLGNITSPNNVSMAVSKIEGDGFRRFELARTDHLEMGVDFTELYAPLKSMGVSSEIQVTHPVSSGTVNYIEVKNVTNGSTFHISAIDKETIRNPALKDPIEHSTRILCDASQLKKDIKNIERLRKNSKSSGSIMFKTADNEFIIQSTNDMENRYRDVYDQKELGDTDVSIEDHECKISLLELSKISKSLSSATSLTVHIGTDKPIRFDISLDEAENAKIIYVIAPRIEN